jgi:uracil-DNA glycosylase family 4
VTLAMLEEKIQACRKCANTLCKFNVEPRPIFSGKVGYPIFLLGQAPGKTEYEKRAPFQGDAGRSIKKQFAACGLSNFDGNVYQTSVTKCFPGRRPKESTDRRPSLAEINNCLPFLERQLEIVKPKLFVCLGSLAWKAFLSMQESADPGFCKREFGVSGPSGVRLPDMVGRDFQWHTTRVLPMIHPAGSANGARAQNLKEDQKSKALLAKSLTELGLSNLCP